MTIEDVSVQRGIDETLQEAQINEIKDVVWMTIQNMASSTIRLAFPLDIKYSVLKKKKPKEIWDKHVSIYESKSLTNQLFLKMDM